jgi:hypothetical protein
VNRVQRKWDFNVSTTRNSFLRCVILKINQSNTKNMVNDLSFTISIKIALAIGLHCLESILYLQSERHLILSKFDKLINKGISILSEKITRKTKNRFSTLYHDYVRCY